MVVGRVVVSGDGIVGRRVGGLVGYVGGLVKAGVGGLVKTGDGGGRLVVVGGGGGLVATIQSASSDPSAQPTCPLHLSLLAMHAPYAHWNANDGHLMKIALVILNKIQNKNIILILNTIQTKIS